MYLEFFGFHKLPFSIAPDPSFLFLGARHREALAHLRHGLSGSGGFLLLTGEVGLGKTTLSRAVLSEFGDELKVTHILNPRLGEREMLAAITEGFGLPMPLAADSLKALTDQLAEFMQRAAEQNIHPVVVIDEAQHLLPSVLEQLRLLTNLETDSRKLLSVVLIGQPELKALLQRNELRQVAQRIVARYQLMPFSETELNAYIDHRLTTVGGSPAQFTGGARKVIWKLTEGTPRLINLLCDRALQVAAQTGKPQVDKPCVETARDVLPHDLHAGVFDNVQPWIRKTAIGIVTVAALGVGLWQFWPWLETRLTPQSEPVVVEVQTPDVEDETLQIESATFEQALSALLALWQADNLLRDEYLCSALNELNLYCLDTPLTLEQLRVLNFPAVISTRAHSEPAYFLLLGADNNEWTVVDEAGTQTLTTEQISNTYTGDAFVLFSLPEAFAEENSSAWREWLAPRVARLVPVSLRNTELERQSEWISQRLMSPTQDDGWLLALLARGQQNEEFPQLRDYQPSVATSVLFDRWQREGLAVAVTNTSEQNNVLFPTEPLMRNSLVQPELTMWWPAEAPREEFIEPNVATTDEPEQAAPVSDEVEVSDALQLLFEDAVRSTPEIRPEASERRQSLPVEQEQSPPQQSTLPSVSELPARTRQLLPNFSYDAHVYQSLARERFIEFDQQRLREGDAYNGLRVISIQPRYTILDANGVLFRLDALESIEN